MAFGVLTRPPGGQIFTEAGPTMSGRATRYWGLLHNKFNDFGPVSRLGVPLENPWAGTWWLYQIEGLPT